MVDIKRAEERLRFLAQHAYNAYCVSAGGKSLVTGDKLPAWDKLPGAVQKAWVAAASEVLSQRARNVAVHYD